MSETEISPNVVIGLSLAASLMSFGAFGDHPYGYFQLLRWVVTIGAGAASYYFYEVDKKYMLYAFIPIAIMFNPIAPIHLDRSTWLPIDFSVGVLFLINVFYVLYINKGAKHIENS